MPPLVSHAVGEHSFSAASAQSRHAPGPRGPRHLTGPAQHGAGLIGPARYAWHCLRAAHAHPRCTRLACANSTRVSRSVPFPFPTTTATPTPSLSLS